MNPEEIKKTVHDKYARLARGGGSCCPSPVAEALYERDELSQVPDGAAALSLGCGNPVARAELRPGETVLDLGSGGGIDVILSARRVAPGGKAYGLDQVDEMLDLARRHQREAGVDNAEFLKGDIERIPMPDRSVDVILSNCVINLAADKDRVFAEAYRVLKPGGRLAISDIVARGPVPAGLRRDLELWAGCVAGALDEADYRAKLAAAGFVEIDISPTRVNGAGEGCGAPADGLLVSALIRARRP
jgi:arsenite methyltransferase